MKRKGLLIRLINLLKGLPKRKLKDKNDLGEMLETMGVNKKEMAEVMQELKDYIEELKKEAGEEEEAKEDQEEEEDIRALVWDNYDDAVEHFMEHIYKNILRKIPAIHRPMFYQFSRDYGRKELSNARKYMVLHLSNYKIKLTEKGIKIVYSND